MLELKNIVKDYKVGNGNYRALNGISLKFKKGEFVAILGPSGCGKTTSLNIIGGLDRYSSGDLVINGTSTKDFNEKDWDAYRNNSVGFVFQSYNLISHLSVLDNVELGMTLSGVGKTERRERAIEVLSRVGLHDQIEKKPTKLSGGEKQRVAIARALVNDPDIILADEPTGALDSKTAHEILSLIKEISQEKLVIMVTHAPKYAKAYASRTIQLLDGEVIEDKDAPSGEDIDSKGYVPVKTSMSFFTALKLSFNNLKTKKFRTTITALASSIGIIGVGLVLSISNGFSDQIEKLESDQLVGLPIMIGREEMNIGFGQMQVNRDDETVANDNEIVVYDPSSNVHKNLITEDFMTYLDNMNDKIYTTTHYTFGYSPTILTLHNGVTEIVDNQELGFSSFITPEEDLVEYYDIVDGKLPTNIYEVVLTVDGSNVINLNTAQALGFDDVDKLTYDQIVGKKLYIGLNDDYYVEQGDYYVPNFDNLDIIKQNGVELTIVGIVKLIDESVNLGSVGGIKHLYALEADLLNRNMASDVCSEQMISEDSVLSPVVLNEEQKLGLLSYLGCNDTNPYLIQIYSDSVENKETIKEYIADYNVGKIEEDQIIEVDLAEAIGDTLGTLISSISVVLSSFASISLVVSSVMIGIIIYISVLERTKEIGIIRSLGGRKKDISRVFNAESVIIGAFAGLLGVTITYLLTFPINLIAGNFDETLSSVAKVNMLHLLGLVGLSTLLTFIGGYIPSRIAAKKNPVEALRVE